ncbi:hypothetical protein KR093_007584 [Drosophila rubida]|uniref:Uncharacterized protein n=1 Tax=Drosophila rubida TaxID=30044 RepID=A0AAD4PLR3_9MUSC|nr:hypothetical protein KR093_007584 [Drosophila rubida]
MDNLWVNFLLIICCGFLMLPQSIHTLRIKRADNLTNVAAGEAVKAPSIPVVLAKSQVEIAKVKPTDAAAAVSAANASVVRVPLAAAVDELLPEKKLELQEDMPQPLDLTDRMFRTKRRMTPKDEFLLPKPVHHAAHVPHVAAPPFVYYNKMISPDGKQEVKEFQLLAPNVLIESLQHDMNYAPVPEVGGVLVLNADNGLTGHMHGLMKPKHHHKHKPSLSALPPFLYMLQQMLQPNLNLDMELSQSPRNRIDAPIYQMLDTAVDNALHSNHEMDHVLADHYHDDIIDKDKDAKDRDGDSNDLSSQKIELNKEDKAKDELLVSCPIHHEHHAGANGDTVDDDVVLVNECHIV